MFNETVRESVARCTTPCLTGRVYLREVWFRMDPEVAGTWKEFADRMVAAHQGGALVMSRADLVFDVGLTEASEIRHETEVWHYLMIG